ncbi:ankyrin repeat-containing domain protein [Hypoxylon fuscum]|nr:ankyrin repeat-containing domain protein [Hypoxylon fuscum]
MESVQHAMGSLELQVSQVGASEAKQESTTMQPVADGPDSTPSITDQSVDAQTATDDQSVSAQHVPKGFSDLPVETVQRIAHFMEQPDRASLASTCRGLALVVMEAMYDTDLEEDNKALFWASFVNCEDVLERLLKRSPQLVNYVFQGNHYTGGHTGPLGKSMTPLAITIALKRPGTFLTLLSHGADVNQPSSSEAAGVQSRLWRPIHWAARFITVKKGFDKYAAALVNRGADLNAPPLLEDGTIETVGFDAYDPTGLEHQFSPLDLAPLFREVNFGHPTRYSGRTDIETNVFHKDFSKLLDDRLRKVKVLLEFGADPNLREKSTGRTPIFQIAHNLVHYQPGFYYPDKNIWDQGEVAEQYEDFVIPFAIRCIEALVQAGGDINIVCHETTILHLLCRRSRLYQRVVKYLLDHGFNVNATNGEGRTAFHELAMVPPSDTDIFWSAATLLMNKGASINSQDSLGCTPLHLLARFGSGQVKTQNLISTMIKLGADPLIKNSDDQTPLGVAQSRRVGLWNETLDMMKKFEKQALNAQSGHGQGNGSSGRRGNQRGRGGRRGSGGRGGGQSGSDEQARPSEPTNGNREGHADGESHRPRHPRRPRRARDDPRADASGGQHGRQQGGNQTSVDHPTPTDAPTSTDVSIPTERPTPIDGGTPGVGEAPTDGTMPQDGPVPAGSSSTGGKRGGGRRRGGKQANRGGKAGEEIPYRRAK